VREAIGILPRAQIAADLKRSDAAVKRWLYDHGLRIKDALGWTAHRFERVAQVPAHRLRGYMDRGELPYYKGSTCTYFDPADFLVVEEVDWRHPPAELERAVRRSLIERIVRTLEGQDWRAGRRYQPRPLFEQGTLEVALGNAYLAPERQDLVGRELLRQIAVARLELGRALDDPLERRPIDARRRALGHATPAGASVPRRGGAWT